MDMDISTDPIATTDFQGGMKMAEVHWTAEAEAAMEKVPFFVRGVAKRAVVKAAESRGVALIDMDLVNEVRTGSAEQRAGN
jgi:hypothetical protein